MNAKLFFVLLLIGLSTCALRKKEDKTKCPKVKAIRNFDLERLLHEWYVIEYYASSEEALAYRCMRAEFTMSSPDEITMNFTYSFTDDPLNEQLIGNITWIIPNHGEPAHWTHSEDTYEGVYNTYVLDSDYVSWALLLHCAEKSKVPRYLSSFIMSREPTLGINVISYLREKLPQYDIDLSFMFDMIQDDCNSTNLENIPPSLLANLDRPNQLGHRRHPMKHIHG
ncbi:apolipoprotein D-like [Euwallacea similis]|uniref:apolipoprotein D-like n=1 Tax=Euwallacea similis TaxID=1736056 RepID=UPI00344E4F0C